MYSTYQIVRKKQKKNYQKNGKTYAKLVVDKKKKKRLETF